MRLLIHFARYGPYHHARLRAAHEVLSPLGWEVYGLETAGTDATYAWDESKAESEGVRVITAFPGRVHEEITAAECRNGLPPLLDALAPDAIAIAGWASPDALACLSWCRKHDVRRIVMSETREADGKRVWWKERIKSYLISRFDGALVGGKSHRDYLVKLGMKPERIAFGYNVVDNGYFSAKTQDYKTQDTREEGGRQVSLSVVRGPLSDEESVASSSTIHDLQSPIHKQPIRIQSNSSPLLTAHCSLGTSPYFLASNRFIGRKNLSRLIDAYGAYVGRAATAGRALESPAGDMCLDSPILELPTPLATSGPARRSSPTWNLVLLGDGEQKPALVAKCHELGLNVIEAAPWEFDPTSDSSSLTPDSCSLTPDSLASHSHPTPLATSGPARRSSPTVFFPGFRQIEELPRFYAHAGCFIHPALEEPWGLVINEAMACGLPVLSGDNVGAAEELIDDGVNGWKFDPTDAEALSRVMVQLSAFDFQLSTFASASRRILEERAPTIAFGKGLAGLLQR